MKTLNTSINILLLIIMLILAFVGVALAKNEMPILLPKKEGSKSFDLEIDQYNRKGVKFYQQDDFDNAIDWFRRALILSKQLRDPSQGILYYNFALTLHQLGKHDEAAGNFSSARRYARGKDLILNSELLKGHECGNNLSTPCEK